MGFFNVQISWTTRITDPSAQTNRPLMFMIWTHILHARPGPKLSFDACISNI